MDGYTGKTNYKEEIWNAITHGIGAVLAVSGLVLLIIFACIKGSVWHIVSFAVFGGTLVLLYLASTLYHSIQIPKVKQLFRKFDHMAIYLLIAGTYTPFCLAVLRSWIGWTIFGIVWACCIIGIVIKAFYTGKKEVFSTIMYVLMGWIIVAAIKPLYESTPTHTFVLLLLGGLSYTLGTVFFVNHKLRYSHCIWHLFVLGGSVFHFFSVLSLLA